MDDRHFDFVTRVLGSAPSRRLALQGLASAALGMAAGGMFAGDEAEAGRNKRRRRRRRRCGKGKKKCRGKCIKKRQCCKNRECGDCEVCRGKRCTSVCVEGQTCINGLCTCAGESCSGCCDGVTCLAGTSDDNCGTNGAECTSCATGQTCQGGVCVCNASSCAGCCDGNTCVPDAKRCGNRCIPASGCCDDPDCPGAAICVENVCIGCPPGQKLCNLQCIGENDPCFTRVTEDRPAGWLFFGEDAFSQIPGQTTIVDGPGDPPIGDGSVKLDPMSDQINFPGGTQAVLRTLQYAGTTLSEINTLSYSIFVPSSGGTPPTMQISLTNVNNTDNFATLVFLPGGNDNAPPTLGGWTEYTPSQTGNWASTRDILGPGGACAICRSIGSAPHEPACVNAAGQCIGATSASWLFLQGAAPDAQVNGPSLADGGFSFRIGRGPTGSGNLTRVVFNDDGYFFEED